MSPFDAGQPPGAGPTSRTKIDAQAAKRRILSHTALANRVIPPPDRLLGDLLTTTTRVFLVGRTGLGKTMLGLALAVGIANGDGFLHWRADRPARVLYIDGEMPTELVIARRNDAVRRAGKEPPADNLLIYARDDEEEYRRQDSAWGSLAPLNTEQGQRFVMHLIQSVGGVDVVIFDNVMSLVVGDQKDEETWSRVVPFTRALTSRKIGQVWLDHTGHNSDRQYGSSTKAWQFDAVGVMTTAPDDGHRQEETAFSLSFEHPGKARRRTPANRSDFETSIFRITEDQWTSEPTDGPKKNGSKKEGREKKLTPQARLFHKALLDALIASDTPGKTTKEAWYSECARTGLADAIEPGDTSKDKAAKRSKFRTYLTALRLAGLIGVDKETVQDLRGRP